MNTINDTNISFRANFITKVKGRGNMMTEVAKNFAERTKSMSGTLELVRGGSEYPGAMIFRLKDGDGPIFSICNYSGLLGQNSKKQTQKNISSVTTKFINIFKTLKAEEEYAKKIKPIEENLSCVEKELIANKRTLKSLKEKNDMKFIPIFESLVQGNTKRISQLNSESNKIKQDYISKGMEGDSP